MLFTGLVSVNASLELANIQLNDLQGFMVAVSLGRVRGDDVLLFHNTVYSKFGETANAGSGVGVSDTIYASDVIDVEPNDEIVAFVSAHPFAAAGANLPAVNAYSNESMKLSVSIVSEV